MEQPEQAPPTSTNNERNTVDHQNLVVLAARWLETKKRCSVVITEMTGGSTETADAIGWRRHTSFLVECKTSRSDFHADKKKISRRDPFHAIGEWRYYLVPAGLVAVEELPAQWGLLEVRAGKVVETKQADFFHETNRSYEIATLISALRRIGHTCPRGVAINCYTIESRAARATLGVRKETNE
jgi:hypothetical protein